MKISYFIILNIVVCAFIINTNLELNKQVSLKNKHIEVLNNDYDRLKTKVKKLQELLDDVVEEASLIKSVETKIKESLPKNHPIKKCKKINPSEVSKIAINIIKNCRQYDLDIPLVLAIIKAESLFCQRAVSHVGARGLMQLTDIAILDIFKRTGRRLDPNILEDNIEAGTYYLYMMLKRFDNTELAVKAYNVGPTYVSKVESGKYSNYPRETINYWKKVYTYKNYYEGN